MAGKNITTALSPRQTFNGQSMLRISGSALRIATWNVRSLVGDGRLENLVSILGLSSTRWKDTGTVVVKNGEYKIYHSSSNNKDTNQNYSIAIIVNKKVEYCVTGFVPPSDMVMMLNFSSEVGVINIIQALKYYK